MLPDLTINPTIELPTVSDIQHYKQLREFSIIFNHKLIEKLPKLAIQECAKKLGILKGKTLLLNCEEELAVVYDYCVFHYRKNKFNSISRYLLMSPPEKDSLEMQLLEAMQQAYYSLLIIKDVIKNKGVLVFDLVKGKEIFLIDLSLSETAYEGLAFASNIIPIGSFYRTSGALLPLPLSLLENEIGVIIDKFFTKNETLSPSQEDLFAAQIVRAALKANVMENVGYS